MTDDPALPPYPAAPQSEAPQSEAPHPAPSQSADPRDSDPHGAHAPRPDLPPAALRALAEAEARRRAAAPVSFAPELGGREGPEPVRYGDWERKGLAVDF